MKLSGDDLDNLWESYHCAVEELGTGPGDLREQVSRALAWVHKHRKLCGADPADAFEADVLRRLARVLDAGARLKTLPRGQLKELASDVRDAERHLNQGLTARAQAFWDQEARWQAEDAASA